VNLEEKMMTQSTILENWSPIIDFEMSKNLENSADSIIMVGGAKPGAQLTIFRKGVRAIVETALNNFDWFVIT
jgi:hypothetical protein